MVEFCKICPKCKKTYTNGAIGVCGNCKIELKNIRHGWTQREENKKIWVIIYEDAKE